MAEDEAFNARLRQFLVSTEFRASIHENLPLLKPEERIIALRRASSLAFAAYERDQCYESLAVAVSFVKDALDQRPISRPDMVKLTEILCHCLKHRKDHTRSIVDVDEYISAL